MTGNRRFGPASRPNPAPGGFRPGPRSICIDCQPGKPIQKAIPLGFVNLNPLVTALEIGFAALGSLSQMESVSASGQLLFVIQPLGSGSPPSLTVIACSFFAAAKGKRSAYRSLVLFYLKSFGEVARQVNGPTRNKPCAVAVEKRIASSGKVKNLIKLIYRAPPSPPTPRKQTRMRKKGRRRKTRTSMCHLFVRHTRFSNAVMTEA